MEESEIKIKIITYTTVELSKPYLELYRSALEIAQKAYAPYSGYNVGAAVLLDNGAVVTGNNQENAAYPSGLCAERVALFYVGAQYPEASVVAIAVAAFTRGKQVEQAAPCGSCRQVLLETESRNKNNQQIDIILCGVDNVEIITGAASLLPKGFSGKNL
jgi:Cytidine deaminase